MFTIAITLAVITFAIWAYHSARKEAKAQEERQKSLRPTEHEATAKLLARERTQRIVDAAAATRTNHPSPIQRRQAVGKQTSKPVPRSTPAPSPVYYTPSPVSTPAPTSSSSIFDVATGVVIGNAISHALNDDDNRGRSSSPAIVSGLGGDFGGGGASGNWDSGSSSSSSSDSFSSDSSSSSSSFD